MVGGVKRNLKRGKNKKKSWKSININDVESYLEDKRLDERLGFDQNHQYFTIEKQGTGLSELKKTLKSKKFKGKLKTTADIVSESGVYKALENTSKVNPCTTARKGPARIPQKLRKKNFLSKFAQSVTDQEKSLRKLSQNKDIIQSRYSSYDLWKDQDQLDSDNDPELKEIEHQQKVLITAHQTKMPVYHLEKRSLLPAVETPHPGASYNPSIQDHQELLKKAHLVELQKKKEEEHFQRVVGRYMRRNKKELEKERLEEMSCGLNLNGDKNEREDGEDSEDKDKKDEGIEQDLVCPKSKIVRAENRKLKSVRRREKLRQLEEEKRDKLKRQKRLEAQVNQVKKLKKEILAEEKQSQERIERRKNRKKQRKYEPARLGPHKYEPPEVELNLSNQLSGNLRNLKTEGLLFEDRIKSLQRRNIIEPRKKATKKSKTKIKLYEKRSRSM